MLYAIITRDAPGTLQKRLDIRPQHLARLERLQAEGRLLAAGPCPAIDAPAPGPAGFVGSRILAEVESQTGAMGGASACRDSVTPCPRASGISN